MGVTTKQIATALEKNCGLMTQSAKALKISRQALWKRIKDDPFLQDHIEQVKESTLDLAENALYTAIKKGEAWAVCFKLKCHGQSRGFIEKQVIENNNKTELTVKLSPGERSKVEEIAKRVAKEITQQGGI